MELNPGDWIALIVGLSLIAAAVLTWRKQAEANRISSDANRITEEANAIARQEADEARQAAEAAKRARLIHRFNPDLRDNVIPSKRSGGEVQQVGMRIENEGPAEARNVRLNVTMPNGKVRQSEEVRRWPPAKERSLHVSVAPGDFGPEPERVLRYQVQWEDDIGPHEFIRNIRVQGRGGEDLRSWIVDD